MCGVQLLDKHLWQQLFQEPLSRTVRVDRAGQAELLPEVRRRVEEHLSKHELWGKPVGSVVHTPEFKLPPMLGQDVEQHFHNIAHRQACVQQHLATQFAKKTLPPQPSSWEMQPGWTRYNSDGSTHRVECPGEASVVFDVEWCVQEGHFPTLAIAASEEAWYGWVSERLCKATEGEDPAAAAGQRGLIPMEASTPGATSPRVVVGHNVGVDRARVLEEYRIYPESDIAYLDTMSMHMITSGLSGQQRGLWLKQTKLEEDDPEREAWVLESSPASLAACSKLWLGKEMDKTGRDLFVKGSMMDIQNNFQEQMTYCAEDVRSTHEVFGSVLPAALSACPHPASFAGMTAMAKSYLPVDESWRSYLRDAEGVFQRMNEEVTQELERLAEEALQLTESRAWEGDPWLSQLDWEVVPQKFTKARYLRDGSYAKGGEPRPIKGQLLPGKPKWYRDLWCRKKEGVVVTARMTIAPLLLALEWVDPTTKIGYPLHHDPVHKWGYMVPTDEVEDEELVVPDWTDEVHQMHETHKFIKLPHKDGPAARCGNPMAKSYIKYLESGRLRSGPRHDSVKTALDNNMACSYWSSARGRILDQFVVWDDLVGHDTLHGSAGKTDGSTGSRGAILPPVVPAGTVTRRAVERTWLTASNPKITRIGSELKSKVVAPDGFKLVGADVDSQELWIASLLGDADFGGFHGATALGWMTLQGEKAEGTDMHSHTARILGISRDQAKIMNYGRIYGAGQPFAQQLLQQFNDELSEAEADALAEKLYAETKGVRIKGAAGNRTANRSGTRGQWWRQSAQYEGGTESAMFNRLEAIASADMPRTPVLGCGVSAALQPKYMARSKSSQFKTSRINWVVQSSAVDYLHLMLVSMKHLCQEYDIKARLCITIHDEVRYLVADEDVDRAAFALHITNLLVRSLFAWKMGMNDLPQSVAFFSGVDIDTVLRKEVDTDCRSPSTLTSPAPGRSVTAYTAGQAVGWSLEKPQPSASGESSLPAGCEPTKVAARQ